MPTVKRNRFSLSSGERNGDKRQGKWRRLEGSGLDTINTYAASPFLLMDHLFTKRLEEQRENRGGAGGGERLNTENISPG